MPECDVISRNNVVIQNEHDYCGDTLFCKRCALHKSYIDDHTLACRSSANTIAISHVRAKQIQDDIDAQNQDRLKEALDFVKSGGPNPPSGTQQ